MLLRLLGYASYMNMGPNFLTLLIVVSWFMGLGRIQQLVGLIHKMHFKPAVYNNNNN